MAKRRKTTRGRSKHPGVVLKQRTHVSGRKSWIARYTDPATGKQRDTTLSGTEMGLTTAEARKDWAVRWAGQLAAERAAIASGCRPARRVTISQAQEEYFSTQGSRLRERTVQTYRDSMRHLSAWAESERLTYTDELALARLAALREFVAAVPKRVSARARRRGAQRRCGGPRSPVTVNRDLRSISVLLNAWRRLGIAPISRDDIADALRPLQVDRVRPKPLKPEEARQLLTAALAHDADCFSITRAERAGDSSGRPVPRYDPVAPLVLFCLLSGCRIGEVASLKWEHVDLAAHDGSGEVVVTATASKTRSERAVRLDVAPVLRALLARLRLAHPDARFVFGGAATVSQESLRSAVRRLRSRFGAPKFNWQRLRQTCASYGVNAAGVYGAASVFLSARRLGHSVAVAERHYLGLVTVPRDARTLEAAMCVDLEAGRIAEDVASAPGSQRAAV